MSRGSRSQSEGNVYHIVQRGVGQQILFEDDVDRQKYVELIRRYIAGFTDADAPIDSDGKGSAVLAWCLMSNHVHLLLRLPFDNLSQFMKRLGCAYVRHFNDRHRRNGHLFQDRFWSEAVDSDAYLLQVVRYIHRNPCEAYGQGLASYPWSSYMEYMGFSDGALADTGFVLDLIGGAESFAAFHSESADADEICRTWEQGSWRSPSDEEALVLVERFLEGRSIYELKALSKEERDRALAQMRRAGLSVRQVARITGIGRGIVEKATSRSA